MKRYVVLSIFCMLMLSSLSLLTVSGSDPGLFGPEELDVIYGENTVTIDGTVGINEWSDGNSKNLMIDSKDWNIGYKHDGDKLQILSNFELEHIFEICLDVDYDGGSAPQTDDILLHMSLSRGEKVGDGSYWAASTPSGWTSTTGFQYTHEISIDFSKLGITPGTAKSMGFYIYIYYSSGNASFPDFGHKNYPNSWNIISSSDNWDEPASEPPELDLARVSPIKGLSTDDYTFSVVYSDPEGEAPTRSHISIDGVLYQMTTEQTTYGTGSEYTYTTKLPWGEHQYYFIFSDPLNEIRYPWTGDITGPSVYRPNSPPVLEEDIPSDIISIKEDIEKGENLLDLEEYFTDDRDDGDLDFRITYEENSSLVHAYVNGSMLCLDQVKENWFGELDLMVKAMDHGIEELPTGDHEMETVSNLFKITVESQNDPVEIRTIGQRDVTGEEKVTFLSDRGASEDTEFSFQVKVADIDLELDDQEELVFSVDDPRFTVEKLDDLTAEIHFTPSNDDVGMVSLNVSVEDGYGSSDERQVIIEVSNTNDEPHIDNVVINGYEMAIVQGIISMVDDRALHEDEWFNASIFVLDDDLSVDPGEGFNFQVVEDVDGLWIDPTKGDISLFLTQEHVGEVRFTVEFKDSEGWDPDGNVTFIIQVINVNDPPYNTLIVPESDETEFENGSFVNLSAIADDIDLLFDPDEELLFEWISDLDGYLGSGAVLSTNELSVGNHNITVIVTDRAGVSTSQTVQVHVKEKDTHYTVGEEDEGVRESLYLGYVVLILIIFFLTIISGGVFVYGRIKRKQLLDNLRRKKIFELVNTKPGVYFMDISKELGLSQGVLSHHLNMLEKFEFVRSMQDGKYRRFYPFDQKVEFSLNLTNIQQMILYIVKDEPGISQTKISESVGKNKVVVNYHVKILRDIGFLDIERDGRLTHCFITGPASDFMNE